MRGYAAIGLHHPKTAMFYETVWGAADGVLFLKGRPHFHYVDGRRADFNSGAPIALVAYAGLAGTFNHEERKAA